MTRKQTLTPEHAWRHGFVTPANIQYVRTGSRRPSARKVRAVRGVSPFFA